LPIDVKPTAGMTVGRLAYRSSKFVFDLLCSSIGVVLLAPLMLGVAIAIRLNSPGPALYHGPRVGLNGKSFYVLKFRTMVANADRIGGSCTPDDDPRITRVGKWLRKTKLDELPQLINVLKGDMSLVGPRPELERFTSMYDEMQRQVLTVRPGITDFATLWDSDEGAILAGEPDPEQAYLEKILPTKLQLQQKYIVGASFWMDLRIIMQTVALVCKRAFRLPLSS